MRKDSVAPFIGPEGVPDLYSGHASATRSNYRICLHYTAATANRWSFWE